MTDDEGYSICTVCGELRSDPDEFWCGLECVYCAWPDDGEGDEDDDDD